MAKLTIVDIAKMADVSISTVSLVINKRPNVKEQTREKVLRVIEQTNFVPSQSARNQITKKTQNIALLYNMNSPPLEHMFHDSLNKCILSYCTKKQYNLVFVAYEFENAVASVPPILRSYGVDGILSFGYVPEPVIGDILRLDLPYVLLDSHQSLAESINVSVDYYKAAYLAMRYLTARGHRKIAYIGSSFPPQFSQQTFGGYRDVLDEADIQVPMKWIQMQSRDIDSADSAQLQMLSILESGELPTAVFCSADIYAVGAMRASKQKGLRIPEDISIIGIDDLLISSYIEPALTSVCIDANVLAQMGCDLLFRWIDDPQNKQGNLIYDDFSIAERKSVIKI